MKYLPHILGGTIAIFAALSGYLYWSLTDLQDAHDARGEELRETERSLESAQNKIAELEGLLGDTQHELENTITERDGLSENLTREEQKNEEFEDQINEIAGTVGVLDKLSKTDKELLQKYSKVYFLNEHYVPEKLTEIEKEYLYDESKPKFIHAKVWLFLEDMLDDAKDDGINIWIVSAYRSFDEQAQVKGNYTVTYGSGANTFSADQGYSEHQLGTTLDLTTTGLNGGLQGFENTPAYEWLVDNAHKYGFTLSYPEENGYYVFEPWHWRFVGVDLAEDLDDDDAHFYDWEQRKIDEYLISIFD